MALPSATVHCLTLFLVRNPPPTQGKTLDQTLREALQPVPNPHSDSGISQLNRIRESLRLIAGNSTAVGLPQARRGGGEGGLMLCCVEQGLVWKGRASGCWRVCHFR